MGPQVRMAGSLSIHKRKTYAADTRRGVSHRAAPKPARPPRAGVARRSAGVARRRADAIAAAAFTVLPDDDPMDLFWRRLNGPRRTAANGL
jgi:hypothetical protein